MTRIARWILAAAAIGIATWALARLLPQLAGRPLVDWAILLAPAAFLSFGIAILFNRGGTRPSPMRRPRLWNAVGGAGIAVVSILLTMMRTDGRVHLWSVLIAAAILIPASAALTHLLGQWWDARHAVANSDPLRAPSAEM